MKSSVAAFVLATSVIGFGLVACGDDSEDGGTPLDPNSGIEPSKPGDDGGGNAKDGGQPDSGKKDSGDEKDSGTDAPEPDLVKSISLKVEDVIAGEQPVGPSSYGYASSKGAFGGTGTSWRYSKPSTGATNEKFEFYIPFTTADAKDKAAGLGEVPAHLGNVTLADIASIKLHTWRNDDTTADFTMVVYTVPHTTATENDASWYGKRLHVPLAAANALNAPISTWNEFTTGTGANSLRFWDYRNKNVAEGTQPANNYFSLADLQKGPVTPAGVTGARDYRTEQIRYISFATNSSDASFDGSIDGIEVVLKNGKAVKIDLEGDANLRRISASHAHLLEATPPDTDSSYGTPSTDAPYGGVGSSWAYVKDADSPAKGKFEFYLPFAAEPDATPPPPPVWDSARSHLGDFTIGEIKSISLRSRIAVADKDFTMIVYTLPDGTDDDKSWYGRRIHAQLNWAASRKAPVDTWNTFSTNAGDNQIRFWDTRKTDEQPGAAGQFTLAQMKAGAITPTGLSARDYRSEKVKFISLSTYSNETEFHGSIDGVEIQLDNGKSLFVDFDQ
ncbi:hypothetical protein [Labilithrix luteola]|nr:hypothetical protein [Labilithrix luteola]